MRHYLLAVLATAVVVLVRLALGGVLGDAAPMLLFVAAALAAAWSGGLRPGLLATGLGAVAGGCLFLHLAQPSDQVHLALFVAVGVLASVVSGATHRHRRQVADTSKYADSIVDTVGEPLIVLDVDLRVVRVNRSFYRTFKVKPEETESRLLYELGNGQWNIPKLRTLLEEILPRHTEVHDYEVEHDFPGVGLRIMRLNARRLYREGSGVTLFLLAVHDITDRERAERAVREGRELLRVTLASVGDGVATTDTQGRVTYLNPVAESLTGWADGEARGRPLAEVFRVVNESTRQEVENPAVAALRGVVVGLANHTALVARGGTERPIDDCAAPIRDGDGKVAGCVLIFRDITQRRRAERLVSESQQQVAATLESVREGVIRYDRDWRVVYANAEGERINQFARSDAIGKTPWELFPAVVGTRLEAEFRRAVADQATVEFENFYEPWGRWYSLKCYPTPDGGLTTLARDTTEQKAQREALAASEARFRAGIEAVSSLVWTNDAQGMMTGEQAGWGNFTGQDREGYQGYGWSKAVHPDDAQPTIDAWSEAVAAKTPFAFEHRVRRHDGQWRLCTVRAVPVFDGQGEIIEWVGVHTDITERKLAETALTASEVRYRRLFESAKDGILILDANAATITDANPFMAELLGYSQDEFVGKELWQIGLFKDAEASKAAMRELQGKGYIRYEDLPLETKAGRRVSVEFVSNVYGEAGEAVIQCNVRDITDRKRMQDTLKESERRFRTLVEQVKDYAIFMTDPEGRATSWNEGVGRVLGFAEGEWVGRDIVPLVFTPEDVRGGVARREFDDAAASGTAGDDRWMVRKDGTRFFALGVLTALHDEAGGLLGFTKVMRDQTDRKRLEDRLRHLAADLSESDRRKDEFLATLAHELRNPLAPIRNGLQAIRMTGVGGAVEKARSMMDRQVTQLVRLVDDLLDISRVTSGKLQLRRGRVELKAVIDAAVETSRPAIEQAGHEFVVGVQDEPIFVDGDHTRLAQVVSNLLNNSAKYTHRGGHIRLAVRREGGTAVVSVTDDGIGIPPAMLEKVFGMFTQVDRTLEKTTGGLGIGLSLVKGLVEMHGGTVEARSEGEGRGSEFVVSLPVAPPAPALSDGSDKGGEEVVTPGPRRILVVDDNADAADSLGQLLELLGNEVRTAYDGEAGVRAASEFRPAVIVCDIGMPKVSGYDAARRVRAEPWGEGMVLVALTGWGQDDDRRKTTEAGFDHHLVKPVEFAALTKLLAGLPAATA